MTFNYFGWTVWTRVGRLFWAQRQNATLEEAKPQAYVGNPWEKVSSLASFYWQTGGTLFLYVTNVCPQGRCQREDLGHATNNPPRKPRDGRRPWPSTSCPPRPMSSQASLTHTSAEMVIGWGIPGALPIRETSNLWIRDSSTGDSLREDLPNSLGTPTTACPSSHHRRVSNCAVWAPSARAAVHSPRSPLPFLISPTLCSASVVTGAR